MSRFDFDNPSGLQAMRRFLRRIWKKPSFFPEKMQMCES
jgi:hypothetical protein